MKYLFVLLTLLFCVVTANKPRLYTRIPQYLVDDRVSNFLNENRITNCFELLTVLNFVKPKQIYY